MPTRQGAITRAAAFFDDGSYKVLLKGLVEIPSTAQEPAFAPELHRYLDQAIRPWVESMGFAVTIHPNPLDGFGPILTAARIEDPALPTVLLYGHGDTVRGLEDQWRPGLLPWTLTEEGDRWYGRGTADNKGQHAINLAALQAVIAERGGRLGFNVKLLLEMAEERGSRGLQEFADLHKDTLAADVLIASDGPRVEPGLPTIATGNRGIFQLDLVLKLREGGVHSGHWGGLTTDPAVLLAHLNRLTCDLERETPELAATAVIARYDPARRRLTWAQAGHPPPLLSRAGRTAPLSRPSGSMLGVVDNAVYQCSVLDMRIGDVLLLYTDGLVEHRHRSLDDGTDALIAAIDASVAASPERPLNEILARLQQANPDDDTCILAARPATGETQDLSRYLRAR